MHLKELSLINFKNYKQCELHFSPKINCFTGLNGAGKTNILDALYFLSLTKSFFNSTDNQLIRHGEKFFVALGEFERDGRTERINCGMKRGQKKVFKRNGKDYTRMADHIGLLPIVMISPLDYTLITGSSEERRKFMDSVISQYDAGYLNALLRYNRAIMQRNKILKTPNFDREVLQIWNEQLFELNKILHSTRVVFIEKLEPIFQYFYSYVAQGKETVSISYKSQLLDASIEELYAQNAEKDAILQYTTVGIHRDDLVLGLGDHAMRKLGSQGQQKTFLVALKFAQFDFMKQKSGVPPLLLLDDIFDKLDNERVQQIVALVNEDRFGQIFITDTNMERMQNILQRMSGEYTMYNVGDNTVTAHT